eukprot:CAMPEP_0171309012 /NCGR_PEP_ID=MMETSP0816-20121228/19154_1 /TAXON_ID=420281 /ORGANISM="Proboscia inermis, Strain CCAP1064/1" /LENGTH=62 /DNA_ID=CAMNT_0011792275 /DNA_START=706 /DNA_END=894 /DNA_ORIENTATION=+
MALGMETGTKHRIPYGDEKSDQRSQGRARNPNGSPTYTLASSITALDVTPPMITAAHTSTES